MKAIIFIILCVLINISISADDRSKMSAIELVNDMGLGWNLGNTFDCFGNWKRIVEPDDQITLWGNSVPDERMVTTIQKYGFNTVRFPVTWMYFMDGSGNIKKDWMKRVKEVVDWIYDYDMYVILNIHHDGVSGNWLAKGKSERMRLSNLWRNIANEFKDYDRRLVFESMNEVDYKKDNAYDYETLHLLTQSFVDSVRATGGNNANRLLLISGANTDLTQTCSDKYILPKDLANMLAVSIHYYLPARFTVESDKKPWTWTDAEGEVHVIEPMKKWGSKADYNEMLNNFETMKKKFTSNGIPVILGEVGVLTEEEKDEDSIREFLTAEYSFSAEYEGIMSCLWDTSKNTAGDMNFYNREEERWYDEKLQNNFYSISLGKFPHPSDYISKVDSDTFNEVDGDGNLQISLKSSKIKKIIFNASITGTTWECGFGIGSENENGKWFGDSFGGAEGEYNKDDDTYTFTIDPEDLSDIPNKYIQVQRWWGQDQIELHNVTIQYDEDFAVIDHESFKEELDSL